MYAEALEAGVKRTENLLVSWAQLEARTGAVEEARSLLREATRRWPGSIKVRLAIAQLEAARGDLEAARRTMRAAAEAAEAQAAEGRPGGGGGADGGGGGGARVLATVEGAAGAAAAYNLWASLEAKHGETERAMAVLEEAVGKYPQDAVLHQSRGALHARRGDRAAARAAFNASVSATPHAPAYVAWALLEAAEHNYDEARRLFEAGRAADPSHAPLLSALAALEVKLGRFDTARRLLEESSARYGAATLWHGWGRLEEKAGDLRRAEELYEEGTRRVLGSEDSAYLWHSLGTVRHKRRAYEQARQAFEAGLQRTPECSQLHCGAAMALEELGEQADARRHFKAAVQADEKHAHAWQARRPMPSARPAHPCTPRPRPAPLLLRPPAQGFRPPTARARSSQAWGMMEMKLSNTGAARDLFERGIKRCPEHAALWQARAKLEAEAGVTSAARSFYKQGDAACPASAPLLHAWAYFEIHQGRLRHAHDLLARAREIDEDAGELWHVQALLQVKLKQLRLARATAEEGIRRAPAHAPLYRLLGSLQDKAGEVEAARASFRQGLTLQPNYAQLYHAWARLEGRVGNLEGLAEINRRARDNFPAPSTEPPSGEPSGPPERRSEALRTDGAPDAMRPATETSVDLSEQSQAKGDRRPGPGGPGARET